MFWAKKGLFGAYISTEITITKDIERADWDGNWCTRKIEDT